MSLLPIVQQALLAGFGEDQILNFLSNRVPSLAKGIKSAKDAGFDPAKILRFLSYSAPRNKDENISKQKSVNEKYLSGIGIKSKEERESDRNKALAGLFGASAGLLGGLNAGKSAAGIGQSLMQGANPKGPSAPGSAPSTSPKPSSPSSPNASPGMQPAAQGIAKASTSQSQGPQQPPSVKSSQILRDLGLTDKIDTLFQEGETPEEINSNIESTLSPQQKNYLSNKINSGEAKGLPEMISDYTREAQTAARTESIKKLDALQEKKKELPPLMKEIEGQVERMQTSEKPQKGNIVATPDGKVGEIKDIKKTEALIDSDGKLHKVKLEDVIESPLPMKDLADLQADLISGIEKETGEQVSRNVNWAGFDPETNELAYLPWDGALYIYDNISPEERAMLEKFMSQRKTTGSNFIGAWEEGTKSPIGAGMSALIKKLQSERGGKGNEYSKKFATIYNALEPSIKAAKAKKRKKS